MKDINHYLNIYKNYKTLSADMISEFASYASWSDEYCRKKSKELYNKLIKEFETLDFTSLSADELKQVGFKWFDENLLCMPMWVMDCLKDGTMIACIDGTEKPFSKETTDRDTRFGVTAYGFSKSQIRDSIIDKLVN
jgi:hypothetical protein